MSFGSQILNSAPDRGQFQHHIVAAPAHEREPRQDEGAGIAQLRGLRPIVFTCGSMTAIPSALPAVRRMRYSNRPLPGQPADQQLELLIEVATFRHERAQRYACPQLLRASRCNRAERSQAHRMRLEVSGYRSVRVNLKPGAAAEPGKDSGGAAAPAAISFQTCARINLTYGGKPG